MSDNEIPPMVSLRRCEWRIESKPLGRGGFGRVYPAMADDQPPAAAKFIPKAPGAEREMLLKDDLSGVPNVVPRLDDGESGNDWVIVMPWAEKSLRDYLNEKGSIPIDDAVRVLIDIAQALVMIEDRIVHRDIKPENILLLDEHWCLTDFGISRYAEATTAEETWKGAKSRPYAAPEIWRSERATSATDVYSVGVVAYEMLTGQPPYAGPDYRTQHLHENPDPSADLPTLLHSLIMSCLNKAPEARPTPQRILDQVNQMTKHGVEKSDAVHQLQQASHVAVSRKAEEERKRSIERSDAERRDDLRKTALQSLNTITSMIAEQVDSVMEVKITRIPNGIERRINEARLVIDRPADQRSWWNDFGTQFRERAFEVVDYAFIGVASPPDQFGYKGRSHSLWFCDAKDRNVFRWYETAFMFHPLSQKMSAFDPFLMFPNNDALQALESMHTYQVAWPFTPIDQGEETDFLERWISWFADAARGTLQRPSSMPERDTGTWRLGNRP